MTELKWEVLDLIKKIGVKTNSNEALEKAIEVAEEIGYFKNSSGWHDHEAHLYKHKSGFEYILHIYHADWTGKCDGEEYDEYYIITIKE